MAFLDDSSSYANIMETEDDAVASESVAEYGTSSLEIITGARSSIRNVYAPESLFSFNGLPFTIEVSTKFNSELTFSAIIDRWRNNLLYDDWSLLIEGGYLKFKYRAADTTLHSVSFEYTPDTTEFHKIAVDYDGTNTRLYIDGTAVDTQEIGSTTKETSNNALTIGMSPYPTTYRFDGWMDEVRITKGVARYAGDYTVATAPFPDNSTDDPDFDSVILLMHFDATLLFGDVTFERFSTSGEMSGGGTVTGDSYMPEFSLSGSIDNGCILPMLTLSAIGYTGSNMVGDIRPLPMILSGGTADGITIKEFEVEAVGETQAVINGDITSPLYSVSGSIDAPLEMPLYSLDGVIEAGNIIVGAVTIPAISVSATYGNQTDIVLPELQVSATGIAGNIGDGSIALEKYVSSGVMYENGTASGDITLAIYQVSGDMRSASVVRGSITMPSWDVAATGIAGSVSSAALTLPLYQVDATGYPQAIGSAQIELMAFQVAGRMDGPAAALNLTTIALNTRVRAVTLYEGLALNSFASFDGFILAASADGIVAMTGNDDLGEPINAYAVGGISDFGSERMKRILTGYAGYKADGNMELTLISDDHHEYIYRLEPRQGGDDLHESRVKFGRGVSGMYMQWRLANTSGGDFTIDKLTFNAEELKRGI